METTRTRYNRLSAPWLILWFYLGAAAIGTLLLFLPACNRAPIRLIDAFGCAVSALTGTGLMSVIPAAQFTIGGKIILLILIQAGGLGVIASLIIIVSALRTKIRHSERALITDMFSLGRPGGVRAFAKRVLLTTLVIELAGALVAAAAFIPVYGAGKGCWLGLFHGVSAFCNAGIDLLGGASMSAYADNPLINLTTVLLVIAGGLGFMTWFDLGSVIFTGRRRHLRVTTGAVLLATAVLLFLGTIVFAAMEWRNADTIGSFSIGGKIAASFYQSVMSRSGGFSIIDQAALRDPSKLFGALLMLIGGAPFSTAGGMKLVTALLLLLAVASAIRGSRHVTLMHRRVGTQTLRAAWVIAACYATLLFMAVFILSALEPQHFIDIVYECAAAAGNAGLSAGITPALRGVSRAILAVLMLGGRLAPVCVMLALARKRDKRDRVRTLPEEQILIG